MTTDLRPLNDSPRSVRPPFDVRDAANPLYGHGPTPEEWRGRVHGYNVQAIRDALAGVELGAYDERIIEWLAGWDTPTIGTVVSLLYRARQAGRDEPR